MYVKNYIYMYIYRLQIYNIFYKHYINVLLNKNMMLFTYNCFLCIVLVFTF